MSWPLEMAEKNQRISRVWKKTPTGRGDFTPIVTGRSSPSCGAKKRFVLFFGVRWNLGSWLNKDVVESKIWGHEKTRGENSGIILGCETSIVVCEQIHHEAGKTVITTTDPITFHHQHFRRIPGTSQGFVCSQSPWWKIKAGHGLHGPMGLEKPEESLFMRLKEPFGKRSWLVERFPVTWWVFWRDGGRFLGQKKMVSGLVRWFISTPSEKLDSSKNGSHLPQVCRWA